MRRKFGFSAPKPRSSFRFHAVSYSSFRPLSSFIIMSPRDVSALSAGSSSVFLDLLCLQVYNQGSAPFAWRLGARGYFPLPSTPNPCNPWAVAEDPSFSTTRQHSFRLPSPGSSMSEIGVVPLASLLPLPIVSLSSLRWASASCFCIYFIYRRLLFSLIMHLTASLPSYAAEFSMADSVMLVVDSQLHALLLRISILVHVADCYGLYGPVDFRVLIIFQHHLQRYASQKESP